MDSISNVMLGCSQCAAALFDCTIVLKGIADTLYYSITSKDGLTVAAILIERSVKMIRITNRVGGSKVIIREGLSIRGKSDKVGRGGSLEKIMNNFYL